MSAPTSGPRKGEAVASCPHEDPIHFYQLDPPQIATAADGTEHAVGWVAVCAGCHHAGGSMQRKATLITILAEDLQVEPLCRGGQA